MIPLTERTLPVISTAPKIKIEAAGFTQRPDRIAFAHRHFSPWLKNSVLDVGCDTAPLRQMLDGSVRYCGIDIGGAPDQVVNLEETTRLPFEDASFETVVCFEVLEHLDSLHRVLDEIFRIASHNVILSLPNCWCSARRCIERGTGKIAHYGLPVDRPVDRHKWFLAATEIEEFFAAQQRRPGVKLAETIGAEKPRPFLLNSLRHLRYSEAAYRNRFVHTVFGRFTLTD
jgi:SAM-dependent methyltransferase